MYTLNGPLIEKVFMNHTDANDVVWDIIIVFKNVDDLRELLEDPSFAEGFSVMSFGQFENAIGKRKSCPFKKYTNATKNFESWLIPNSISEESARNIEFLMKSSQKIRAIKLIKFLTGWGLKDAKDFCESHGTVRSRNVTMIEVKHGSCQSITTSIEKTGDPIRKLLEAGVLTCDIDRAWATAKTYEEEVPFEAVS